MGVKVMRRYRRYPAAERKKSLVEVAARYAERVGLSNITRDGIARIANVSHGLITFHFGNMPVLRGEIIKFAIENEILPIISQAIIEGDIRPESLKLRLRKKLADVYLT